MNYILFYGGSLITHTFFVDAKLGKKILISKQNSKYFVAVANLKCLKVLNRVPTINPLRKKSVGGETNKKYYENNYILLFILVKNFGNDFNGIVVINYIT